MLVTMLTSLAVMFIMMARWYNLSGACVWHMRIRILYMFVHVRARVYGTCTVQLTRNLNASK